jgi:hypothetical protein
MPCYEGRRVYQHLYLRLDPRQRFCLPAVRFLWALGGEPMGGPTDKVGCESGKVFLQEQRGFGTDLQVLHLKDLFAFFDTRFDGLAAVAGLKPSWQVGSDGILSVVEHHTEPLRIPGVEALQCKVQRIGKVLHRHRRPGGHFRVMPDLRPDRFSVYLLFQACPEPRTVRLDVHLIAQFNQ